MKLRYYLAASWMISVTASDNVQAGGCSGAGCLIETPGAHAAASKGAEEAARNAQREALKRETAREKKLKDTIVAAIASGIPVKKCHEVRDYTNVNGRPQFGYHILGIDPKGNEVFVSQNVKWRDSVNEADDAYRNAVRELRPGSDNPGHYYCALPYGDFQ